MSGVKIQILKNDVGLKKFYPVLHCLQVVAHRKMFQLPNMATMYSGKKHLPNFVYQTLKI